MASSRSVGRVSNQIACTSCCHCQSIRASRGAQTSNTPRRGVAARGERLQAIPPWRSAHQTSASSGRVPAAATSRRPRLACRALRRSCRSRRPRRGTCSRSNDQRSGGRRQNRTAGSKAPRPQQNRRSTRGKGPGSPPASRSNRPRASRGQAARPSNWSQRRGSLKGSLRASLLEESPRRLVTLRC